MTGFVSNRVSRRVPHVRRPATSRIAALLVVFWVGGSLPPFALATSVCIQEPASQQSANAKSTLQQIQDLESQNGVTFESAKLRYDLAIKILRHEPSAGETSESASARALEVMKPILTSLPKLLDSFESAQLTRDVVVCAIRCQSEMGNYEAGRRLMMDFVATLQKSSVPNLERLPIECRVRLTAADIAFSDENWDFALDQIRQILAQRAELLKNPDGARSIVSAGIQSIRYLGVAGRFGEIRGSAATSLNAIAQAECWTEQEKVRWQSLIIDQALDFTDSEGATEDVAFWNERAEDMKSRLIASDDPDADGFIAELFDHTVRTALRESTAQANHSLADFQSWLRSHNYRACESSQALNSYVTAAAHVLNAPTIKAEEFRAKLMLENAFLDEVELSSAVEHAYITNIRKRLDSAVSCKRIAVNRPEIGQAAPSFQLIRTEDGTEFALEELRGKVVLLDFWHVRCGPCIAQFPHLAKMHETYSGQGLAIIGCTFFYPGIWAKDDKPAEPETNEYHLQKLREFAAGRNVGHPLAVATQLNVDQTYGITSNPTAFLIDRDGIVRGIYAEGFDDETWQSLEASIKKLLQGNE